MTTGADLDLADPSTDPHEVARAAAAVIADRTGAQRHDIALVLGSGWKPAAEALAQLGDPGASTEIDNTDVPGFTAAAVAGLARLVRRSKPRRSGPVVAARARALVLAPVGLIIPMAVWSLAATLHDASAPACEFYGPAGKPAWLSSPLIMAAGHRLWPTLLLASGAVAAVVACARLGNSVPVATSPTTGPVCSSCGYSLQGLPDPRCPECGAAPAPS